MEDKIINKINQLDENIINGLRNKYQYIVNHLSNSKTNEIIYVIEVTSQYLNTYHKDLDKTWKSWIVFIMKKLFENNKIDNENQIIQTIEKIIQYKNNNYDNYLSNIEYYVDDYSRDIEFINSIIEWC
jgi:hypothetical protein